MEPNVVVFGQLARDLVLVVDQVPAAGQSGRVRRRREMLGGKGANQAVALAQLGMRPALAAVAGDDQTGTRLIEQAGKDGIDTSAVIRREGTRSGLIVDVVTPDGQWRYLEDLPPSVLLTEADVAAAEGLTATAPWVSIQLQQPSGAVLAAARQAATAGARVVLDGAPDANGHTDDLLALASVVRADAREASLLTGTEIGGLDDARSVAQGRDGCRLHVATRTRGHVVHHHGKAAVRSDLSEVAAQSVLGRAHVIRRHHQRRIGTQCLRTLRQRNGFRGGRFAGTRDHRHAMIDTLDRERQQALVFVLVQHVGFAGGTGHHDALGAAVELVIDQPPEYGQVERAGRVERRHDGAQAAGDLQVRLHTCPNPRS